jgi:hypothetical protein
MAVCQNGQHSLLSFYVSVGVAKGYGLDVQGSIPGKKFVSVPQRPDRLWGPHSRLFNDLPGTPYPEVKRSVVKLITHFYLVLRSRMMELYLYFPIRLHGVVLN